MRSRPTQNEVTNSLLGLAEAARFFLRKAPPGFRPFFIVANRIEKIGKKPVGAWKYNIRALRAAIATGAGQLPRAKSTAFSEVASGSVDFHDSFVG